VRNIFSPCCFYRNFVCLVCQRSWKLHTVPSFDDCGGTSVYLFFRHCGLRCVQSFWPNHFASISVWSRYVIVYLNLILDWRGRIMSVYVYIYIYIYILFPQLDRIVLGQEPLAISDTFTGHQLSRPMTTSRFLLFLMSLLPRKSRCWNALPAQGPFIENLSFYNSYPFHWNTCLDNCGIPNSHIIIASLGFRIRKTRTRAKRPDAYGSVWYLKMRYCLVSMWFSLPHSICFHNVCLHCNIHSSVLFVVAGRGFVPECSKLHIYWVSVTSAIQVASVVTNSCSGSCGLWRLRHRHTLFQQRSTRVWCNCRLWTIIRSGSQSWICGGEWIDLISYQWSGSCKGDICMQDYSQESGGPSSISDSSENCDEVCLSDLLINSWRWERK